MLFSFELCFHPSSKEGVILIEEFGSFHDKLQTPIEIQPFSSLYFTKEIRPLWSCLKAVQGGYGQSIHSATFFRLPCPLTVQSSSIYLFLGLWRYVETLLQRCCCECFLDYWHYFPALLVEDRLKTVEEHLSIWSCAVTGSPITPKANFNSPNWWFISCRCGLVQGYWVDGWCIRLDPIFRSMHSHPCRNWFGKLRVWCTENCLRSPKLTYSWQPSSRPTTYNTSHYSHWARK